jgi:hypothetical protein
MVAVEVAGLLSTGDLHTSHFDEYFIEAALPVQNILTSQD